MVRGRDKSFAVRTLLDEGMQHVTYVGDALFPGGNDAAVSDYVAASWPNGSGPELGWQCTSAASSGITINTAMSATCARKSDTAT